MDVKFQSTLDTFIQTLGRETGPKKLIPPVSQDPADALLHEFYVADKLRAIGENRRKLVKESLPSLMNSALLKKALEDARKLRTVQRLIPLHTEHYVLEYKAAAPVAYTDHDLFIKSLIGQGVSLSVIDKAFQAAKQERKPAETYVVTTSSPRD